MSKAILLEQFHVTVFVPAGLGDTECKVMARTLRSKRFHANLREGVRQVLRRHPSLKKARITVDQ